MLSTALLLGLAGSASAFVAAPMRPVAPTQVSADQSRIAIAQRRPRCFRRALSAGLAASTQAPPAAPSGYLLCLPAYA